MAASLVIEGAWERVVEQAEREGLAGKHVRLIVLDRDTSETSPSGSEFHLGTSPDERARAWEEWCHRPRPRVPPLSDEAISRESIYSPERD